MTDNQLRKLKLNTIFSFLLQVITLVSGFILPKLILEAFGSKTNGLVNSIMQFLQVIAFLELGVGAVVRSSLFKPLAEKDFETTSKIVVSAQKFFRNIGKILILYVTFLVIFYPLIVKSDFEWLSTAFLILAISISFFSQYFFGVVDNIFLIADQRGYVGYFIQIVTIILNVAFCFVLIKVGASIQIVKLTTSLIFLLRPIVLRLYINSNYALNRKITYTQEPIKQKWNGIAQHFAAVILDGTDNIVLTIFSTLENVSIYAVYNLVINGVKNIFSSLTNSVFSLVGELWAKEDKENLHKVFNTFEWLSHNGIVLFFGITGVLIVPFIRVYTKGINDANYSQLLFAIIIISANGFHLLRDTYNIIILSAGHYKQTQRCYIIAMILNIVISIATVLFWGLVGVAIGTLVAMTYQTIWMAIYNSKRLLKTPFRNFIKHIFVDLLIVGLGVLSTMWFEIGELTYLSWFILAIKISLIWVAVTLLVNLIFNRKYLFGFFKSIKNKFRNKKQLEENQI